MTFVRIFLPLLQTAPGLGDRQSSDQSSHQKSLLFYNHTECECQSKVDDMMPRDTMPTSMGAAATVDLPLMHRNDEYVWTVDILDNSLKFNNNNNRIRLNNFEKIRIE